MSRTVITFGTFDVFHVGHLRVITRAADLGDRLVVGGVGRRPQRAQEGPRPGLQPAGAPRDRRRPQAGLGGVRRGELEQKRDYILEHGADVLVMGDDWEGRFDEFRDVCEVVYLPRTPAISTTALIEKISGTP